MSEAILSDNSIVREERQAKEWTPAKVIYTGLMAFNLLSYLWLLVTGSGIEMPPIIWITRVATAPLAIYLGKLWKDRGFQILAIYTCLFFFRVFIPNPSNIFSAEIAESIFSALWLFAGCYGLCKILNIHVLRLFVQMCSGIWIVGMTYLCCIGIYAAWTMKTIWMYGPQAIYIWESRLWLIYPSTVSGALIGLTILLLITLILSIKNCRIKIFFIIQMVPMFLAFSLTDTRASFISVSAGLSAMIFVAMYSHKIHKNVTKGTDWKIIAKGFIACILVFFLFLFVLRWIPNIFNQMRLRGVFPTANAEATEDTIISTRGFQGDDAFTGRIALWKDTLFYLFHNLRVLLIGASKLEPLRGYNTYYSHCHNTYLQVLLESGIPGLLLLMTFYVIIVIRSIKIINHSIPIWIKLLPAIMISLLIGDLAECYLWLRSSQCPMSTVFFITAGIISSQVPIKEKTHNTIRS